MPPMMPNRAFDVDKAVQYTIYYHSMEETMDLKGLSILLLLIPGLALATASPAGRSESYAIGDLRTFLVKVKPKYPESLVANKSYQPRLTSPDRGAAFYERQAEIRFAEIKKILMPQRDDNNPYVRILRTEFEFRKQTLERLIKTQAQYALFEAIDADDVFVVPELLKKARKGKASLILCDTRSMYLSRLTSLEKMLTPIKGRAKFIGQAECDSEKSKVIDHLTHIFNRPFYYADTLIQSDHLVGFTPLMRTSARGNVPMIAALLKAGETIGLTVSLMPSMVDPEALINKHAVTSHLISDITHKPFEGPSQVKLMDALISEESFLPPGEEDEFPLSRYTSDLNELVLAAIGGHIETVDLLLAELARLPAAKQRNFIQAALKKVIVFSRLVDLEEARVLYRNLGMRCMPSHSNYLIIAQKLINAFKNAEPNTDQFQQRAVEQIKNVMFAGTSEMLQLVVQELGLTDDLLSSIRLFFDAQVEETTEKCINGEKLGILLLLTATSPSSVAGQFGRGMLERVEQNPTLLASLKKYMQERRRVKAEISEHMIPNLADIVDDYITPRPSMELFRRIIALGNRQQDDQSILGEEMEQIILGSRPIQETQSPSLNNPLPANKLRRFINACKGLCCISNNGEDQND